MKIVVETYGAHISIETGVLQIDAGEEHTEVSLLHVTSLHIQTSARISSDALTACIKSGIPVYFENDLEVEAMLWSPHYGSIANIRKKQALFSFSKHKYVLIKRLLIRKNEMRIRFLQQTTIIEKIQIFTEKIAEFNKLIEKAPNKDAYLRSLEGNSSKKYFEAYNLLLPAAWRFDKRTYQNSSDLVNNLLNYGYGILYKEITKALIIAGLDPDLGFFHAAQYHKPGLSFDLIEPYRVWVEEQVLKTLRDKTFKQIPEKLNKDGRLGKETKRLFIEKMTGFMTQKKILWQKRIKTPQTHIQLDAHQVAKYLLNFSLKDLLNSLQTE